MKKTTIAILVLFATVVVCGCSGGPQTASTIIDVPPGIDKWELIRQYVKDNYGPPDKDAPRDTEMMGEYVVSKKLPTGQDGDAEYRKQIRIFSYYPPSGSLAYDTRLKIQVIIEKRGLGAPDQQWRHYAYDEAEQDKIANELQSILN